MDSLPEITELSFGYGCPDYFARLKLFRTASHERISRAFKTLSSALHPDKHPEGEVRVEASRRYALITEAYSVLSDPERRAEWRDLMNRYRHKTRLASARAEEPDTAPKSKRVKMPCPPPRPDTKFRVKLPPAPPPPVIHFQAQQTQAGPPRRVVAVSIAAPSQGGQPAPAPPGPGPHAVRLAPIQTGQLPNTGEPSPTSNFPVLPPPPPLVSASSGNNSVRFMFSGMRTQGWDSSPDTEDGWHWLNFTAPAGFEIRRIKVRGFRGSDLMAVVSTRGENMPAPALKDDVWATVFDSTPTQALRLFLRPGIGRKPGRVSVMSASVSLGVPGQVASWLFDPR
eukprot:Hpha_TRINITY_DN17538_c0_g1::TRINITY_DN17538_c0_g1_i1::g.92577::m.92577